MFQEVKELTKLALPICASRIIGVLANFLSVLMISQLGYSFLSASALIAGIHIPIISTVIGLIFGVSILIAESYGAKKKYSIQAVFQQGLLLAILLSIPVVTIYLFSYKLLLLLGQEKELALYASQYLKAYAIGVPAVLMTNVLIQFVIGISYSKTVTLWSLLSMIFGLIPGYLFLFGKCGMPKLGIMGAGFGFSIGSWLLFFLILLQVHKQKIFQKFELFKKNHLRRTFGHLKKIFNIGWPISVQIGGELILFSLITIFFGWLGETALAARQIIVQTNSLFLMIPYGLGQAGAVLACQYVGRRNPIKVREAGNSAFFLGLLVSAISGIIYFCFPEKLCAMYLVGKEVHLDTVALASQLFLILAAMQFFDVLRTISANLLRCFYDTFYPMVVIVFFSLILSVPVCYALGFTFHFGACGILWGSVITFAISSIILMLRWNKKLKNYEKTLKAH